MSCPFRFNHAWLKPRHPGEGAIERMALAADPTRTFAITPAEAWAETCTACGRGWVVQLRAYDAESDEAASWEDLEP